MAKNRTTYDLAEDLTADTAIAKPPIVVAALKGSF